nr:MAG TPA: hypothetical protein [Crassvirales sp.]DAL80310.1 MAG TPA: hypothetical protein [Caudoviricetes sp.]DAR45691.1 MAG TPA: hypothetical protein [Bacteriophage sp.]DAQ45728.1 MAG TPA: hypothetical protein [Caudoviricetes sp.]DAU06228.1 MAG TPA: hypothetical protein [Caudoviricetes sp.]
MLKVTVSRIRVIAPSNRSTSLLLRNHSSFNYTHTNDQARESL